MKRKSTWHPIFSEPLHFKRSEVTSGTKSILLILIIIIRANGPRANRNYD